MTQKCGYIKDDGEPCQRKVPEGTCYSHPEPDPELTPAPDGGRPTKFVEERVERLLEAAEAGLTIEGCARCAGIHFSTLYDWLDQEGKTLPWDDGTEFGEAFRQSRARGEMKLVSEVSDRNPQFILERSYDYVKTERREIEADVDASISGDLETEGWEIGYSGEAGEDD